jgi:transcriptional regulator with XRE-family HTH domain
MYNDISFLNEAIMSKKINNALRLCRVYCNMNVSELISKIDYSNSYISEIESGKKTPTSQMIGRYAEWLEVPISSLMLFAESLEQPTLSNSAEWDNPIYFAKVNLKHFLKMLEGGKMATKKPNAGGAIISIEEQVQAAKNEFGEKAFERLKSKAGLFRSNTDLEKWICAGLYAELKPLPELYAHDNDFYIDAFLMWQWRYADGSNGWTDCNKPLSFKADKEYRRKESAGLLFNLKMAIAGDAVECLRDGILYPVINLVFPNRTDYAISGEVNGIGCTFFDSYNLRMKYPPRKHA